jgi:exopolyphosphatase/guanosine-5'-triphosphate,3'-diphosphate pyrophosphatase
MLKHDPPEPAELSAAAAHTELVLGRGLDRDRVGKSQRAVAVAGTATSLAAIDLGLEEYDREKVHGHLMDKGTIESHLSMLAKQTSEERRRIPTLEEGRADVIVAGAMILAGVMTITGAEEIYISEKDLLDGAAIRYVRREL